MSSVDHIGENVALLIRMAQKQIEKSSDANYKLELQHDIDALNERRCSVEIGVVDVLLSRTQPHFSQS